MNRRFVVFLAAAWLALLPSLTAQAPKPPAFTASASRQAFVRASAETITAGQLRAALSFVASDEMEGRADPSRGLDITARYLASSLARIGAAPAGDGGTYMQRIVLRKDRVVAESTTVELGGTRFVCGKDFITTAAASTVTAPMVFAADGWFVKAKHIDPYQGMDLKGKVVVLTSGGLPTGVSFNDLGGKQGEDWISPVAYARQKGAVAIVQLQSLLNQANPDMMDRLRRGGEEGRYYVEKFSRPADQVPTVTANLSLAQAIFNGQKVSARSILMSFPEGGPAVKPFELSPDKKITITVKTASDTADTQNVVAVIEGSDPVLKNEYVALGAHYDHIGTMKGTGDTVYNGADDDGSGTVALLAMAESLRKSPRTPKRSVLFVWHMGEEMGEWGSRYFTTYPTVPLDRIVAQLNIDMIGRSKPAGDTNPKDRDLSGPNELYVIGSKMMSDELGALSEAVNDNYLKLSFNYKYDDPKDPEQFFYRSDQINYATKGIPVIFYFTGVHADYHGLGDEVSKIDFRKFEKITRTIYLTMWELGEMKTRPKVERNVEER
jgi:hypothetical protein